jgi:hypothetical protein
MCSDFSENSNIYSPFGQDFAKQGYLATAALLTAHARCALQPTVHHCARLRE